MDKASVRQVANAQPRGQSNLIPLLATLSGACGLAYEILYIRLFTNYFGDSFLVTGVTLCTVFLGIAFGAWVSSQFLRLLWIVEAFIGLYAFGAGWALSNWGFEIAAWGGSPLLNAVKLGLLLGLPAFLIGTCVPLFAAYARFTTIDPASVFARVYGLYNLGAFLSVLAIEFALFRMLGLQQTLILIGCLNLSVAAALLVQGHHKLSGHATPPTARLSFHVVVALALASFASGVFQLLMLRLSFAIFGPLNENFAIVLASAILGVALGSALAARIKLTLAAILPWSALLMLIVVIAVPAVITMWAQVAGENLSDGKERALKALLLAGLPLPSFVLFGTLVPVAVAAHGDDGGSHAGRLLAVSSLGNGLGALTMFVLLYRILELPSIAFLCAALLAGAALLVTKPLLGVVHLLRGGIVAASLLYAGLQSWPHVELLLGYRSLMHAEEIAWHKREYEHATIYKAYDHNATLVHFADQTSALVLNGYRSLSFGPGSRAELHEVIVGASPALFGKATDQALVFGLGSGITGGATARLYAHTKIVEINPAMLNMPQHFLPENHNVMTRPGVEVVLEDGISTLISNSQRYDAIVNTVTSPQYYSAAKLYTRDFYEIVKSRLTDGGVYSSWFDVNIDSEGIAIMLNTLEASFAQCRYFLLTGGYFNAVCGEGPLLYLPSETVAKRLEGTSIDEMFARFGFDAGVRTTLAALELEFSPRFMVRETSDLNTLDRPIIEFVVAREQDASATMAQLGQTIAANVEYQRRTGIGSNVWQFNCRNLSKMSGLEFSGC